MKPDRVNDAGARFVARWNQLTMLRAKYKHIQLPNGQAKPCNDRWIESQGKGITGRKILMPKHVTMPTYEHVQLQNVIIKHSIHSPAKYTRLKHVEPELLKRGSDGE